MKPGYAIQAEGTSIRQLELSLPSDSDDEEEETGQFDCGFVATAASAGRARV